MVGSRWEAGTLRAYLGMGSNLGDRRGYLQEALAATPDLVAVSRLYETSPVGGPPGQGPYLNLVAALDTRLTPRELLEVCHELEQAAGRVRTVRFGPRTLDVDVLLVGDLVVDEEDLVVPHPRMFERRFVLAPLADLAPEVIPQGAWGRAGGEVSCRGTLESFQK
jgi:2-amino-4-hydroxy-6-hydroxymethyldihydropteridine diphosphokinase